MYLDDQRLAIIFLSSQLGLSFFNAYMLTYQTLWLWTLFLSVYGKMKTAEAVNQECTICKDQIRLPTQLPCSHRFCYPCIRKWHHDGSNGSYVSCPLCRDKCQKLTPISKDGQQNWWEEKEHAKLKKDLDTVNFFFGLIGKRDGMEPERSYDLERHFRKNMLLHAVLPLTLSFCHFIIYSLIFTDSTYFFFRTFNETEWKWESKADYRCMSVFYLGIFLANADFLRSNILMSFDARNVFLRSD